MFKNLRSSKVQRAENSYTAYLKPPEPEADWSLRRINFVGKLSSDIPTYTSFLIMVSYAASL
jgi:hypothetical protein